MRLSLVIALLLICCLANAQKTTLLSGSLTGLKEEKSFDIKFTYDSMVIGAKSEKQYLAEKKKDWEMKEPGKGSAFVEQWFTARKELYEPVFISNFEKYYHVKLKDADAKYTLIVKTMSTEGGWNTGVVSHSGEISGELLIVESANESHVIATVLFFEHEGRFAYGGDFEMTKRIQSAYQISGGRLGDFLSRKVK